MTLVVRRTPGEQPPGLTALARLLSQARRDAGLSQLELAFRLGVSQRHVAYVERGRAGISRALILQWTGETHSPRWLRNAALLQAGFAPTPAPSDSRRELSTEESCPEDIRRILASHEPFPAHAFDPDWTMIAMNPSARWLCSQVMPGFVGRLPTGAPLDMIAACAASDGLLSTMENGHAFGLDVLGQLRAEATVNQELRARADTLEKTLVDRYGLARPPGRVVGSTVAEASFKLSGNLLRFSIAQGVFNLPHDTTSAVRRVELWFPMDAATRGVFNPARDAWSMKSAGPAI